MGRLAFWKEGDTDRDGFVILGGDKTIDMGMAEALDGGSRA